MSRPKEPLSEVISASVPTRRKRMLVFSGNVILACVVLMAGDFLIHARAAGAGKGEPAARVTVQSIEIERVNGYEVEHRFVGLVESPQEVDVAFETAGTIESIPVVEGGFVKRGSVIATIDQRSVKAQRQQIVAARKEAVVALQRADLALVRERELGDSGYGSKQNLDNSRLEVEQSSASLIRMDAQLRAVDIALTKGVLRAPFDAVVGERIVEAGMVVASGQPVIRLFEQGNPTVRIGIPVNLDMDWEPREVSRLTINGQEYTGRYVGKRPDVAAGTRVIETRFELQGVATDWPAVGQMATLHWMESRKAPGYWVPIGTLSEGKRGLWSVFRLVREEGADDSETLEYLATVVREHVEVVHTDGDRAYVQGALPETVQIVLNGSHRVVPQQQVQFAQYSK